jgi:hypothetical protein
MSVFGDLTPAPVGAIALRMIAVAEGKQSRALEAMSRNGTIAALWALKLDTAAIAKRMRLRESEVANRLAAIRDGQPL